MIESASQSACAWESASIAPSALANDAGRSCSRRVRSAPALRPATSATLRAALTRPAASSLKQSCRPTYDGDSRRLRGASQVDRRVNTRSPHLRDVRGARDGRAELGRGGRSRGWGTSSCALTLQSSAAHARRTEEPGFRTATLVDWPRPIEEDSSAARSSLKRPRAVPTPGNVRCAPTSCPAQAPSALRRTSTPTPERAAAHRGARRRPLQRSRRAA